MPSPAMSQRKMPHIEQAKEILNAARIVLYLNPDMLDRWVEDRRFGLPNALGFPLEHDMYFRKLL